MNLMMPLAARIFELVLGTYAMNFRPLALVHDNGYLTLSDDLMYLSSDCK